MFAIFDELKKMGYDCNTYENEVLFYKKYYELLLCKECETCNEEIKKAASELFDMVWLKERCVFNEVIPLFEELKQKGIKIGIISDTTPSLQKTLESLNLGKYIDCYTCSTTVGVMKPNPKIYYSALSELELKPDECIYVDDYLPEAIGAKELGFTAFRINRKNLEKDSIDIQNLSEILNYLQ